VRVIRDGIQEVTNSINGLNSDHIRRSSHMKRSVFVVGLLLLMTSGATAQTDRKVDVFLGMAAEKGDTEAILVFLGKGADVNAVSAQGKTALLFAALNDRIEAMEVLLANGADANASDIHGYTALIFSAGEGRTKLVKLLLDNGADMTLRNDMGLTALGSAKLFGHFEIIRLLREAGATE